MRGDPVAETIGTYDVIAADYADTWVPLRLDEQMSRFRALTRPGGTVLDLGCGPARDTGWVRDLGFAAVGVHLSPGMLAQARARAGAGFVRADMRMLPLGHDTLDG